MENTFKGYKVEEILDGTSFGLKEVVEQKLCSKLDGMLNTENAIVVNGTTIYYVKGLYQGSVKGFDLEDVEFVVTLENGAIGYYA